MILLGYNGINAFLGENQGNGAKNKTFHMKSYESSMNPVKYRGLEQEQNQEREHL